MKKMISLAILMAAALTFGACGKEADPVESEETAVSLSADYPVYNTAQELVDQANLIFSGTVENITYELLDVRDKPVAGTEEGGSPYAIYEVRVTNIYKGSSEEDTICIKCPSGGVFDGMEYAVENAVSLEKGREYLLLAETYENAYPSLLNPTQAVYDLDAQKTAGEDENNGITLPQILKALK